MPTRRVGIIGYGLIGSYVCERLAENDRFEIAFICDSDKQRLAGVDENLILEDLNDAASRSPDLVCELAHASVSRAWGARLLSVCDYFALSVTALADAELERELTETARKNSTTLFVPHGGVMGLDAILDGREVWDEVSIEMTKHPDNLDFAASGIDGSSISAKTILYDGPTRGVCAKFPRNVNTHATLALAGIGLDRTRSRLIADPAGHEAVLTINAHGGGVDLSLHRSETITGVSGASTPWSVLQSIIRTASAGSGMQFC